MVQGRQQATWAPRGAPSTVSGWEDPAGEGAAAQPSGISC